MPVCRSRCALLRRFSALLILLLLARTGLGQVKAGRIRHFDDRIWKQYYYRGPLRYGFGVGRTWYQGDLTSGFRGSKSRSSIGVAVSSVVFPNLEAALEVQYLRFAADDQVPGRGYHLKTRLVEAALLGRYYIERYQFDPAADSRDMGKQRWWRMFVVAGVGEALWWAKTTGGPAFLNDSIPNTQSEQKYPAYATIIPVGAGFALRVSPQLWLSPEVTYRFALTDNLDDVGARRGSPARNDGYWQLAFRFQYQPSRSMGKQLH